MKRLAWILLGAGILLLAAFAWQQQIYDDAAEVALPPASPTRTPFVDSIIPTRTPTTGAEQQANTASAVASVTATATATASETAVATAAATPQPTATATRLPTVTPTPALTAEPTEASPAASATPPPATATPSPTAEPTVEPAGIAVIDRFGIATTPQNIALALSAGLPFGTIATWGTYPHIAPPDGVAMWQMVRVGEEGIRFISWDRLAEAVAALPGAVWIVGNEPDVEVQDNVTPWRYAEIYHEVYTFIKERDPSAQIAIAGVAQPTPLRRQYLDIVLDTYQANYGEPMPVDVWNVHAYVLREERGSWGAGIPIGLDVDQGMLYDIEDHADLAIWRTNLIDFRRWMDERGYGDRPLALTEFGILLPADLGFPPETVNAFMAGAFDFMRSANNETGYPADGDRLVQWWFWYTLIDEFELYNGNLLTDDGAALSAIGQAWTDYVRAVEGEEQ